ncbi:IS110 family transposase [filamentous cyanobacterium CCP5]|nr:IS110 family transposase [filamentous cyanobacterium CCP5]
MEVVYRCVAAIDIGKRQSVVHVKTPTVEATRSFGMMTADLLELADWLRECGVQQVVMESTGVYWKPIYNLLEGDEFDLWLVNARDFRSVPGRKTDVQDSEWLCNLMRHGLLRRSFVPPKGQRELRELVRYRRSLIEERAREFNRLEKVLEGANVKLGAVASKLTGKSVRLMLTAMVNGEADPKTLAELAKGRLRNKRDELVQALQGLMGAHQRFLLKEQLGHLADLDTRILRLDLEVEERLRPFVDELERLQTIPGVGARVSQELLVEIGWDMSRFPSAQHLASWAKLCPGNNLSAGKRKHGRTGHGNRYLRTTLTEAAHAAGRKKNTYLQAQYQRLASRRGQKRAAIAVAHSILTIAYHLLVQKTKYQDLGANYFDERKEQTVVQRLQRRLEKLGYQVDLTKQVA